MDKASLQELVNGPPKPLWQLKPYNVAPEQLGERELAIRERAFELGDRSAAVGEALYGFAELTGVYDKDSENAQEIQIMTDAETGKKISAVLSKNGGGTLAISYFETTSDGVRSEIPGSHDFFDPRFGWESYSAQELDLSHGRVAWSHEERDIDIRPEILEVADVVISKWEGTARMLDEAIRNPELNPELAVLKAQKDAKAAEKKEATAAFIASLRKH